ncbi:MAG: hypothetical protein QMD65_02100 [Patescibacteria group bacterium]|nr:hypothetical protein [Patescibacteria group bacterium]
MDKITADFIFNTLKEKVENKQAQFDANFWIESAAKLNLLLGDEQDEYFNLRQKVAEMKLEFRKESKNVSEVNLKIEAAKEYTNLRKQEAKIKRIEEFVRISKAMSRVAQGI